MNYPNSLGTARNTACISTTTQPPVANPPSQTRDYLDELNDRVDNTYKSIQDMFVTLSPILRPESPTDPDKNPLRSPETQLNTELEKLLDKIKTMQGFLNYNIPRIAI